MTEQELHDKYLQVGGAPLRKLLAEKAFFPSGMFELSALLTANGKGLRITLTKRMEVVIDMSGEAEDVSRLFMFRLIQQALLKE